MPGEVILNVGDNAAVEHQRVDLCRHCATPGVGWVGCGGVFFLASIAAVCAGVGFRIHCSAVRSGDEAS